MIYKIIFFAAQDDDNYVFYSINLDHVAAYYTH